MRSLLLLVLAAQTLGAAQLALEHARTPEARTWGLMGRCELPDHQGMLFHFPYPGRHSIWMFNCRINLDLAFLDKEGVILELHHLKAHPDWMDPDRPIRSLQDLGAYAAHEPIVRAFQSEAVFPSQPVTYALEVPEGWFATHGISPGDQLSWDGAEGNITRHH